MATGILMDPIEPHEWTHDYESVFWLLLWICAGRPVYREGLLVESQPNFSVLNVFDTLIGRPKDSLARKHMYLFVDRVEPKETITHPYYAPLAPCLRQLRELFYAHRCLGVPLTRQAFRNMFVKWIARLEGKKFKGEKPAYLAEDRFYPTTIIRVGDQDKTTGSLVQSRLASTSTSISQSSTKRRRVQSTSIGSKSKKTKSTD